MRRLDLGWPLGVIFVAAFGLIVIGAFKRGAGRLAPEEKPSAPERVPAQDKPLTIKDFYALPPGAIARLGEPDFRGDSDPAVAFSSDGTFMYTTAAPNEVRVWDAKTRRLLRRFKLPPVRSLIKDVRSLPDGSLAVYADRFVLLADPRRGLVNHEIKADEAGGENGITCMEVTTDGKTLAVGDQQGRVRLYDTASARVIPFAAAHPRKAGEPISAWVNSVSFSRDGRRIVSAAMTDRLRVWDVRTGKELLSFDPSHFAGDRVAFSPDDRLIAVAVYENPPARPSERAATELWQLDPLKRTVRLEDAKRAHAAAFTSDGRVLVMGGFWLGAWDARTGKRHFMHPMPGPSSHLTLTPDEKYVIHQGRWWELATGQELYIDSGHVGAVVALTLSADGKSAATAGTDGTVRAWDVATQKQLWYRTLGDDVPRPVALAFSPKGDRVAALAWDHRIHVLDAKTGKELLSSDAVPDQLAHVAWSPDGLWLAAGSGNYSVFLFDCTFREVLTLGREAEQEVRDRG